MPISRWETIAYAIRSAHIVGSTKGRIVRITDEIQGTQTRDVYPLYCSQLKENNTVSYEISDNGSGESAQVYWVTVGLR